MEVFMRNVPQDLTGQGLRIQLRASIEALHIKDWLCQKANKKPFATVTFLHHENGSQFLRQHEQQRVPGFNPSGKPRYRARLNLLGAPVFCALSTNPPNQLILRSLEKAAEDRAKMKR